jgi:hypothetical protein
MVDYQDGGEQLNKITMLEDKLFKMPAYKRLNIYALDEMGKTESKPLTGLELLADMEASEVEDEDLSNIFKNTQPLSASEMVKLMDAANKKSEYKN